MKSSEDKKNKIIIFFGLPGTGKSTIARLIAHRLHIRHINTDIIRAILEQRQKYDDQTKSLIYAEMMKKVEEELHRNQSIVVDGTFYRQEHRDEIEAIANDNNAICKWILMSASEKVIKKRVSQKRAHSEADFEAYKIVKGAFDPVIDGHLVLHSDEEEISVLLDKAIQHIGHDEK